MRETVIRYTCDRCGKDLEENEINYVHEINHVTFFKIHELCNNCSDVYKAAAEELEEIYKERNIKVYDVYKNYGLRDELEHAIRY